MAINKDILLKKLTGALKDGIQVIDQDGVTILYNRKMEIIENRQARDLIGKTLYRLPNLNANDRELLRALKTGLPRVNLIYSGINVYGNQVLVSNSIWPISDKGKTVGAVEIAVDITEVRRLHQMILGITKDMNQLTQKGVKHKDKSRYHIADIIGESQAMKQVKHMAELAGKCDANVMIVGASGTGKELVAQSIHNASSRHLKPMIAENCAAIPENLLESAFFGTVKGGFTGAVDRPGLFQLADGGTLVLDEINSLPVGLQAKLLRVLQDGAFRPVGSGELVEVDVRIIAITNQEPELLIGQGLLREDLFYRLNVIDIFIPSLLEREGDVQLLTGHFLEQFSQKSGKTLAGFSPEVLQAFRRYPWKGNVRELSNVVECGVSLTEDKAVIQMLHLPYYFAKHFQKDTGNMEAPGIPGTSVPMGVPGIPSASVPMEAPGIPGTSAPMGAPGIPGTSASMGAPGIPGTSAPMGAPGIPGTSTPMGAPGIPGTSAFTGAPGIPSASASMGAPGIPGTSVPMGVPGIPGTSAPMGAPGIPGTSAFTGAPGILGGSGNLTEYLSELEETLIRNAMNQSDGNVSRAAERLGITRQGLQHKLRKMGI